MMSESFTSHALAAQTGQTTTLVVAAPPAAPQEAAAPSAGTAAGALVATLACIAAVIYFKKHKGANTLHLVIAFTCGVLLAGTVFGSMAASLANSVGGSAVQMVANVGVDTK